MKTTLIILLNLAIMVAIGQDKEEQWLTKFEKSNYMQTVSYDECIAFSKKLAHKSEIVHYSEIGWSPQKRAIPMLIIDKDGYTLPEDIKKTGRLIMFIQAGIHAGEPDGTDAGFMLIRDMIIYQKHLGLLDKVSILFIPSFNVDGLARMSAYNRINQNGPEEMGWRTNSNNLNLNRDYMKADSPEMKAWLKVFHQYLPDFFIDCHTTDGADYQYVATYGIETYGNMDKELTQWLSHYYEPKLKEQMQQKGSPIFPYVSFKKWHDPRSGLVRRVGTPMISQGYTALQNRIGLLIETHMLKAYKPRVYATYNLLVMSLEMMNAEAKTLKKLHHNADLLMSSEKLGPQKLCVAYQVDYMDTTQVDFLGIEYDMQVSDLTGGEWFQYSKTPATFQIDLFENQVEETVVKLPKAYIIPVEYPEVQEIIKSHGISFFITDKKHTIEIETYKFSQQKWGQNPYEGHHSLTSFKADPIQRKTTYEAGAMVVPVRQRALKVLTYLLEPKADNSFVSWGFFNASMEQKEYSETYVMEKMARKMIAENPDLLTEFEAWKKENPQRAKSQWLQCNWFYQKSPYWDQKKDVYPVGKITDQKVLFLLGQH